MGMEHIMGVGTVNACRVPKSIPTDSLNHITLHCAVCLRLSHKAHGVIYFCSFVGVLC